MAFGFGFNKQKVLSAAEKYVQQGKLQNAISEYEKILKADAKDLTVLNTVGDLYSRLGEADKATECFKSVGDAYAAQGFTVKGIAMYKKIAKLKPSLESVLKLAELYTQQGLFNDARAQYLQVAEEFLRAGELEQSVRIFQKILEMDPENVAMRVRLAEVYIRLGKKTDAWQIFSAAAENLLSRGSRSGAEEILQRMLSLDPGNSYALLLRGRNALEAGDAAAAIPFYEKVADIENHPDGLRDLLKAYLQTGRVADAGRLAEKLLSAHNDLDAMFSYIEALVQNGGHEEALQVIDQQSDRLLADNSAKVLETLRTIVGHVSGNAPALEKLLELFHKAGDQSHINEVNELLAHACVQSGDLARARDLYQNLAEQEPQNPMHMQNYQQVVGMMGGSTGSKLLTMEEGIVLVEELEATAPRRSRLQFFDQHDPLFHGEQLGPGGPAHHANYLLVVLHVHGVLGFLFGEILVEVARPGKIAGLHTGMSEKFVDFVDVGLVPGLVKQFEELLERGSVAAHVSHDGAKRFKNFCGVVRQQAIGLLVDDLECFLVTAVLHQGLDIGKHRVEVVVGGEEFFGKASGIGNTAGLQIGFQQVAQTIGMILDVGDLFVERNRRGRVPGFERIAAAQQERVAVARIEAEHALQDFFGAAARSPAAQVLGGGGENLPG